MKYRDLPLSALRAFAVTAEWQSMTKAANELGVTHGAVSRQVGQLEKWLGTSLFVRHGRSMVLTPSGELLSQQLGHSFNAMRTACTEISLSGQKRIVTVEAPTTFAMYWLLPRISYLEEELKNVDILLETRLSTQQNDSPASDIVITRGHTQDRRLRNFETETLLTETLGLVASQAFISAADVVTPKQALQLGVVGSVTRPNDWPEWLRQANLVDHPFRYRHMFDHLFIALHCVLSGIGCIVAPVNVLGNPSQNLRFMPLLPDINFDGETYYLRYRSSGHHSVKKLCALLRAVDTLPPGRCHVV